MTRWQPCARCGKARRVGTRRAHVECADCRSGMVPRPILRALGYGSRKVGKWNAPRVTTDAGSVR